MAIFKKASITPIVRSVVSQGLEDIDFSERSASPHASVEASIQSYIEKYKEMQQQAETEGAMENYYINQGVVDGLMLALKILKSKS